MKDPLRFCTAAALIASASLLSNASAASLTVTSNLLDFSGTILTPFAPEDNLSLNTHVTIEPGPLTQSITFTVGAGVTSIFGGAEWLVTPVADTGPRLVGVNIDLIDSSNVLAASDSFVGLSNGVASSTFFFAALPGTYRLVATGTAIRAAVLDVSLDFGPVAAVPESQTSALLLAGLGVMGLIARRRLASDRGPTGGLGAI